MHPPRMQLRVHLRELPPNSLVERLTAPTREACEIHAVTKNDHVRQIHQYSPSTHHQLFLKTQRLLYVTIMTFIFDYSLMTIIHDLSATLGDKD